MGIALGVVILGSAWAQPFTIRRPADGSTVREVVAVRIPKNSIPQGGYVGFWINGKFLEAVLPDAEGNDYVWRLDTKKNQLPDGELSIEAVLYVDFEEAPKEVNRTSVKVNLDNSRSIPVPKNGFVLRYNLTPGLMYVYNVESRSSVSTLSQTQNQLGGRASELPLSAERFRVLYAVESSNKVANGAREGLVRIQPMPRKGKDSVYLAITEDPEPKKYMDYEMAPFYMRMTDTGREISSSWPAYIPMEGSSGDSGSLDLVASIPWPILPAKAIMPGSTFPGVFQNSVLDPAKRLETNRFFANFPAQGRLEAIEWEGGIPCAKLKKTISIGTESAEGKALAAAGRAFADDKITLDETVWFALDRKIPIKVVRDITIDRKAENVGGDATGVGGGPAAGGGGARGGRAGGGMMGPPGGRGGRGSGSQEDDAIAPQRGGGGGMMGPSRGQAGGGTMGPPGGRGGRGGGNTQAGGRTGGAQFVRIRQQFMITLEK